MRYPRATDPIAELVDFGVAQIGVRHSEQRRDSLLGRPAEIRPDDVLERIVARYFGRRGGRVHVPRSVFLVLDQLLLAKNPKDRSDRRVRRRVGKLRHDLGHGRLAAPVKDLHDLAFPPGEVVYR